MKFFPLDRNSLWALPCPQTYPWSAGGPTRQSQLRRGLSIWAQGPWHRAHLSFSPVTYLEQSDPTLTWQLRLTSPYKPNFYCYISVYLPWCSCSFFPLFTPGMGIKPKYFFSTDQMVAAAMLSGNCQAPKVTFCFLWSDIALFKSMFSWLSTVLYLGLFKMLARKHLLYGRCIW